MKPGSALQNQLHRLLSNHAVERDIREFFDQLDAKVSDISSADNASSQLHDLEEDLQIVYSDVDHSRLQQVEIFVDVLYHTRHILPTSSIIGTWFDLLLRRALREPRLASPAVKHARELVLQALENPENSEDKVLSFRRRLVDLFLLDVLNENSGKDILEWAELDEDKRQKNTWWKSNLEEILVHHGLQKPAVSSIRPFLYMLTRSVGLYDSFRYLLHVSRVPPTNSILIGFIRITPVFR